MNKINAIIIDDEKRAQSVLTLLLNKNCPNIDVIGCYGDVISGVEAIKELKPQLVFLDVQMPNYNGYELIKFISKITFEIIFVTAFDQYAIKAFELNAADYLLKPVNREQLKLSVNKAIANIEKKNKIEQYETLIKSFKEKKNTKIVISESQGKRVVEIAKIMAIEGQGAYSTIHLKNAKNILVSKNLKHFEELLSDEKLLIRCQKSWIVNLDDIVNVDNSNLTLTLSEGLKVKFSSNKKSIIENYFIS
jgi:two-component system LytT family response regulator